MKKQVLFIHGGGDDGYGADAILAASLQDALGQDYQVIYPQVVSDESVPDFGWLKTIREGLENLPDNAIWVGHSVGASMWLKHLSENKVSKKAAGIFLIAPPFWSGKEDWKQGLILQKDFAKNLSTNSPLFFYHCKDDDVVPTDHIATYRNMLPEATFREIGTGGHQLNNDLSLVAKDILEL